MMSNSLRKSAVVLGAIMLTPFAITAEPAFEDAFNGTALDSQWEAWDGHAEIGGFNDPAHYSAFGMTGTHLSVSFPPGGDHNQWDAYHSQVVRSYLGSGAYETKVDSTFTGAQQFGVIFEGAEHGTFLMFMLYSYVDAEARAYVERFSNVGGQLNRQTFHGGGIGRTLPAPGPYYLRVTVDDHPMPQHRIWKFEWSPNGANWTVLVEGILEAGSTEESIGAIQKVGLFAGNQPRSLGWPKEYDGFDGRFDYFRYYTLEAVPLAAPANLVAQARDNRVDLTWNSLTHADVYAVYGSTTAGGPYTQLGTTTSPSFSHVGALNDTRHYYVVTGFRSGVEGPASLEANAVPHGLGSLAELPTAGLSLVLTASELAYTLENGDPVSIWPTAVGSAGAAIGPDGSKPTFVSSGINGQPAVRFDGLNDYLTLSGTFTDFTPGMSVYLVAKPAALSFGFKYLLLGNGSPYDGIGFGRAGSTPGFQLFTGSGSSVSWFDTSHGVVAGQASLLSIIQEPGAAGSETYAEVAKNGVPIQGDSLYVPPVSARTVNYIGKSYWADGLFQGDIAEVIVYNRKLSASEQAAVRAYAAVKYGLAIDGHSGVPQPVETPVALSAIGGDNSVALSWSPVTDAAGYRVYRTDESQSQMQIATVTSANYLDTTVANGFSYEYTVTAYDAYAESPQSTPVIVTPTAPVQLPQSVPTSGLVLGLDAATALQDNGNNQPVGVWRDSSSSHAHAMTAGWTPTVVADALNGKPVVRFDGIDDYLTLPSGFHDFSAGMTVYIVARPASLPNGFKMLLLGNGSGVNNIGFGQAGSSAGLQYFTNASGGAVSWFDTGPTLVAGQAALVSVVQQPNAGGMSYAEAGKDGIPIHGQTMYSPPIAERSENYIGNSYWYDGKFHGDIAEILIYNRALTSVEQTAVRQYLGSKYGISVP